MGFLNQLLKYKNICIQCHNSPDADALAAAYGVYTYLKLHDINVSIIYSGDYEIQKKNLLYMIDICEIPVEYVKELPKTDLLLLVDGQYGRGNVYRFEADNIAMIDHHMPSMKKTENAFIDYSYQSCSTIVWELLKEEGYDVKANEKLSIAFLYGLYTDTSSYVDLYKKHDIAMRDELSKDYPELERLKKSSMSLEDLMIAGEALYHAYFDKEKQYLLISAMHCEQSVLGIIGDMAIKVNLDVLMAQKKKGLTELAKEVDITLANLSILKNNKAKAVRFSTLESICKALDCQPGDILIYEDEEDNDE